MNNKILDNYFFVLFSLIPVSIIFGPAISLITVLLIDFSFIFLLLYKKDYKFLSNKTVKLILLFCLYLVFNSIISKNFLIGMERNFGFIRFGILFCAFNYFFYHKNFFNKILTVWSITLLILTIDAYIESITGKNILGYGDLNGPHGERIISLFKNEPIVGGYINAFYLIIVGYLFNLSNNYSRKYKNIILIVSIIFLTIILLTGERSNTIKAFLGFFIFYYLNDFFNFKQKFFSIILLFTVISLLISGSDYLKLRYAGQFLNPHNPQLETKSFNQKIKEDTYFKLYQSGFNIFKDNIMFGVGNKNYRIESCSVKKKHIYICNTHPHQTYFEFLSEHGLLGGMILLTILFNLVFGKLKIILKSKNYVQIGCFIFLLTSFVPFLPSGAFFADYSLTIFWINLSLMYSINKKTNIFSSN